MYVFREVLWLWWDNKSFCAGLGARTPFRLSAAIIGALYGPLILYQLPASVRRTDFQFFTRCHYCCTVWAFNSLQATSLGAPLWRECFFKSAVNPKRPRPRQRLGFQSQRLRRVKTNMINAKKLLRIACISYLDRSSGATALQGFGRQSGRRRSAKIVPTFADRGVSRG